MLPSIVQLSLRSIYGAKLLRTVNLRSTIRCRYSKWVSRRPVAIVNKHELFDTDDTTKADEQKTPKTHRGRSRVNTREGKEKKEKQEKQKENEIKECSATKPKYIALKADDKLIRYIIF